MFSALLDGLLNIGGDLVSWLGQGAYTVLHGIGLGWILYGIGQAFDGIGKGIKQVLSGLGDYYQKMAIANAIMNISNNAGALLMIIGVNICIIICFWIWNTLRMRYNQPRGLRWCVRCAYNWIRGRLQLLGTNMPFYCHPDCKTNDVLKCYHYCIQICLNQYSMTYLCNSCPYPNMQGTQWRI